MSACKEYLDRATDLLRLVKSGQKETKEIKDLEEQCRCLWDLMTDEEKDYVGEQTIRIGQWL